MRRLPVIVAGTARVVLPMADRSAAVLVDVLLANSARGDERSCRTPTHAASSEWPMSSPQLQLLAEAITQDPPLFVWTACQRASADTIDSGATGGRRPNHFRPRGQAPAGRLPSFNNAGSYNCSTGCCTARQLAAWLAENATDVLKWDNECKEPLAAEDSGKTQPAPLDEQAWADRVAAAVEAAETARLAADETNQEQAYAAALLSAAERWLPRDSSCHHKPAVHDCRHGGDSLDTPAKTVASDVAALAHSRALQARDQWLAEHAAAGLLPLVAARIARLEKLQNRFDRTLLAEKLEAMAEFAAGAGHEINNPVAVISGRAQLLLQGESDPQRRHALALINAQARRVYEMIADMMLFARPPAPKYGKIDLGAIVDRAVGELQPLASEQSIELTRIDRSGSVEVEADAGQINVAVRAMIRNSLEAISHDGHVDVDLRADVHSAVIRIIDDGPGMPADVRRHVFDPFYSARQAGRGLGMGLSKCWRIIVTNHHGRIDVDSREGRSGVFTITLPVRQANCRGSEER